MKQSMNVLRTRNLMRRRMDQIKDSQNFYYVYAQLSNNCNDEIMWQLFGKGAIDGLSIKKAKFLKQVKEYHLDDVARELLQLYTEEVRNSIFALSEMLKSQINI